MPSARIVRKSAVKKTPRVQQLAGIFDVDVPEVSRNTWQVNLDIEDEGWNVGLIVGPSGSGKSTVLNECFSEYVVDGFSWPPDKSLVDAFPKGVSIKEITGLLSKVGFSSPPSWLRPYGTLSTGEKFRVMMARALIEHDEICAIDEFTSVIDRTVARIGSSAIAKTTRKRDQKFVAASCHYDIIEWMEPDWVYEPHTDHLARDCLQRPDITITVKPVDQSAWRLFKEHHYMNTNLSPTAVCYVGFVEERPAVFASTVFHPHPVRPGWREHRTVCLPDFQGVGIGNAMSEYVASLYAATDMPYRSLTSHPAMVYYRARSKKWHMYRKPTKGTRVSKTRSVKRWKGEKKRKMAGFEYRGVKRPDAARCFGINPDTGHHVGSR